jgi:hypothetical protein
MVKQLMYSITVTYFTVIWNKKPGKLSTVILLQNNVCPHTADLMVTLAIVEWEIMNHLP